MNKSLDYKITCSFIKEKCFGKKFFSYYFISTKS